MAETKNFFPVVYLRNGDACVGSPCKSEDECRAELKKAIFKHKGMVKATTYMVRESESTTDLFGSPKSRDLMQDKKVLAELGVSKNA